MGLEVNAVVGDVSVVVCSYNASDSILSCLTSVRNLGVKEILLVDGGSTDGTVEMAEGLYDRLLRDPREGLGKARNIGLREASGDFILNLGVDNQIDRGALLKMLGACSDSPRCAVSCKTILKGPSYLERALNVYKAARFFPGERNVIGTPSLFRSRDLKTYEYDELASFSDDAEICDRMGKDGFKFYIIDCAVVEVGDVNLSAIVARWRMYGISDYQVFSRNYKSWSTKRKMISLLYPIRNELLVPIQKTRGHARFFFIPFFTLVTVIRYYYWAASALKSIKR